jgi:hypothetical protein
VFAICFCFVALPNILPFLFKEFYPKVHCWNSIMILLFTLAKRGQISAVKACVFARWRMTD